MTNSEYLRFVKASLGLTSSVRDDYLEQIIKSVVSELKGSGIDPENQTEDYKAEYDMYVIDYSAFMYKTRGGETPLEGHLRFRRNNLILNHV